MVKQRCWFLEIWNLAHCLISESNMGKYLTFKTTVKLNRHLKDWQNFITLMSPTSCHDIFFHRWLRIFTVTTSSHICKHVVTNKWFGDNLVADPAPFQLQIPDKTGHYKIWGIACLYIISLLKTWKFMWKLASNMVVEVSRCPIKLLIVTIQTAQIIPSFLAPLKQKNFEAT